MKQFGETDSNEFNYDTCCTIFRNLIEQIEKENKVNSEEIQLGKSFFFLGTSKTFNSNEIIG